MTTTQILLLLLTGLLGGITSGAFGVGGGIVIIPALVFIVGFTQHQAQGTNLAMMLPPIVILAAINYYKSGYVNIKAAIILMAAFLIGSYLGSEIAIKLEGKTLKKMFGILMLISSLKMILGK